MNSKKTMLEILELQSKWTIPFSFGSRTSSIPQKIVIIRPLHSKEFTRDEKK